MIAGNIFTREKVFHTDEINLNTDWQILFAFVDST